MKNSSAETKQKPVNIAHIISHLNYGGVQRMILDLLKRIDRTRFNPVVICLRYSGDLTEEFIRHDIPVYVSRVSSRWNPVGIFRLRRLLRSLKVHLVHTHMYRSNTTGTAAAWFAGIPLIINQVHSVNTWDHFTQLLTDRSLVRFKTKIIFVSETVKSDYCSRVEVPQEKQIVIYNGVDLDRYHQEKRRHSSASTMIVGAVGRFKKIKGFQVLIRAAAEAIRLGVDMELNILGDGETTDELMSLAGQLNLADRIRFVGYSDRVPDFLAGLDVFVMPSLKEGFGLAVVEAMASGLPVIASDIGAFREIVRDGTDGILFRAGDPISLAQKLQLLARDHQLRNDLGANAGNRALKFSAQAMAASIQDLYNQILDSHSIR